MLFLLVASTVVAQVLGQCYDPVSGVQQDYCHGGFCQITQLSTSDQSVSLCICPPRRSGPMCSEEANSIEGPFKLAEQKWAAEMPDTTLQAPQGASPDFKIPLLGVFVASDFEDCKRICERFNTDYSSPPIQCGTIVYHTQPSPVLPEVTLGICEAYTVKPIKGCETMLLPKPGYKLAFLEPFFQDQYSCH